MSSTAQLKDYYRILGIPRTASTFEIEQAYEKLANQWHPDRNKTCKEQAEKRFQQVNEAFQVLYNRGSRAHYDEIFHKGYSISDAEDTFNRFFDQHDVVDEEERSFFSTKYPQKKVKVRKDYFQILGVPKGASLEQIKAAYRKQALKYHPKNTGNSQEARQKFVEVNEAYQVLSDRNKRDAHEKDFFGKKPFEFPSEQEFFRPVLRKKWSRVLDRMMEDDSDFGPMSNGETVKQSTVYNNDNGVTTRKNVKSKRSVINGSIQDVRIEEYVFPNGQRQITKTTTLNGLSQSKKYFLKGGEETPKQLTL